MIFSLSLPVHDLVVGESASGERELRMQQKHPAARAYHLAIAAKVCIWWLGILSFESAAMDCLQPDRYLPYVSLGLVKVEFKAYDGFKSYEGHFVLKNHDIESGFFLEGSKEGENFYVNYPRSYLEFKDLNRTWVRLSLDAPGTFMPPPDQVFVEKNASVEIRSHLFLESTTEFSGSDFRLVVVVNKDLCVISYPFRALPERSPITEIKPVKGEQYKGLQSLKSNQESCPKE